MTTEMRSVSRGSSLTDLSREGDFEEADNSFLSKDLETDSSQSNEVEWSTSTRTFPENLPGAAMAALIRTIDREGRIQVRTMTAASVLGLFVINLSLQAGTLYWVNLYVCGPTVGKTRKLYEEFHNTTYIDGEFDQVAFMTWDETKRAKLCQLPMSEPPFTVVLLTIWTATVMASLSEISNHGLYWFQLPAPYDERKYAETQINENSTEVLLVRAGTFIKALVLICILIPEAILSLTLWWLGARWLVATTSLQDVVVNVVALAFILDLDEIVYRALLPMGYRHKLQSAAVAVTTLNGEEHVHMIKEYLGKHSNFLSIVCKATACILVPYLYLTYYQQVLPDYQWDVAEPCLKMLAEEAPPLMELQLMGGKSGRR